MSTGLIWMYCMFALCGLFFQIIINSGRKIVSYPTSLVLGIFAGVFPNYFLLFFNFGMIGTNLMFKSWTYASVQSLCLLNGFLVGFYLL